MAHSTRMLVTGATRDTCPNTAPIRGMVSAMAPREADTEAHTPRQIRLTSRVQPARFQPSAGFIRQAYTRGVKTRMPATDKKDSCSPTLNTQKGF